MVERRGAPRVLVVVSVMAMWSLACTYDDGSGTTSTTSTRDSGGNVIQGDTEVEDTGWDLMDWPLACSGSGCTCESGQACAVDCLTEGTCGMTCLAGSGCDVDCMNAATCQVDCGQAWWCRVDCGTATSCVVYGPADHCHVEGCYPEAGCELSCADGDAPVDQGLSDFSCE